MEPKKYCAYLRVSTSRQEDSGLGLSSQRSQIKAFIKNGDVIVKEYVEILSGKHASNRPILQAAMQECLTNNYILVVAKQDRLSRSVLDTFTIYKKLNENLVICDMPFLSTITLAVFSSLAESERSLISSRTRDALAELKLRGVTLGNPRNLKPEHRTKGNEVTTQRSKEFREDRKLVAVVESCVREGMNNHQIAEELNRLGFTTSRKKQWNHLSVYRLHSYIKKTNDKPS